MAGIYIHIPFCRKACHYCDFHFSTSLKTKENVLEGIRIEALQRRKELATSTIQTIYFGGGTPSILESEELGEILRVIHENYSVSSDAEITLEANPEDISSIKVKEWKELGINRLSIGIQSFDEEILSWMNRSHNADQALSAVKLAKESGIENVSIDLIYGVPHRNSEDWKNEILTAITLNTDHISAYCLTIEPDTVFGKKASKGEILSSPNSASSLEFLELVTVLSEHNIELYEVSNFSKLGCESKHNSNYWNGAEYIGLGPGAHSYGPGRRSWNISNNVLYAKGVQNNTPVSESETLSTIDEYNEYIMTNLRRVSGLNLEVLRQKFNVDLVDVFSETINQYQSSGNLVVLPNIVKLSIKGFLLADRIASDLFLTHD